METVKRIAQGRNANAGSDILGKVLLLLRKMFGNKCELDRSMEEVRRGKVHHANNAEDLMKQVFGNEL